MSTSTTSNDLKKAAGYFKEKLAIGMSRVSSDELARAIMKVTSHKLKAPNEKHMERLIEASYGRVSEKAAQQHELICQYIVEELELRSHTHNWIIVLKTMVTFHRLMQEGSNEINTIMQRCARRIFSSHSIKDIGDTVDGVAQQRFIEQYMRYLEERCATQQRLGLQVRLESSDFASSLGLQNFKTLSETFPLLVNQLECAASVTYRDDIADNFLTLDAYERLAVDCKRLHAALMNRALAVLENFSALELASKKVWVDVFAHYFSVVALVQGFFEVLAISKRHFGIDFPRVVPFPPTLLKELKEELDYASVPVESLEDLIPPASETVNATDRVEAQPAQPAPTATATAPQPAAAPQPPTAPKADLDDLFGPSAPVQAKSTPTPQPQATTDLFAGDSWGAPKAPAAFEPVWSSEQASAPSEPLKSLASAPHITSPTVAPTSVSAPQADFDPFDDAPPQPKADIVDFFSTQKKATPAPNSTPAPRDDGRAW